MSSAATWAAEHEIKGDASNGSLWALFYHRTPRKEDKTIWRMTGNGELHVYAIGPKGQKIKPLSSPDYHYGSSWKRPGEEWGIFWKVPSPGKWTFHAKRSDISGTVAVTFK